MDTESDIIFREEQRFATWPYILICVVIALFIKLLFADGLKELTLGFIIVAVVAVLFALLKLQTIVRLDGLYVRFFPLHLKFRKFPPEQISEYYPLQYHPIRDYGGWGIRCRRGFKDMAYNTRGNKGVQLVFANGRKLLIGTQKPDELAAAIKLIGK